MRIRAIWAWLGLALTLVAAPATAQITVPAGTMVNLGGATLSAACADMNVAGLLAVGSGQLAGARAMVVAGGGTLDGGSGVVGLSGNFSQSGNFVAGTGAVQIVDGCATSASTFTGISSFYGFSIATAIGRSLVFPAGQTQSVAHALSLTGAAGALVTIRSSSAGTAGNLALANGATQTIDYVDVADNHATVQPIGPGIAATYHSVKGSNSNGWFQIGGPTGYLNDTGFNQCLTNTNTLAPCATANTGDNAQHPRQDGRFGRDAAAAAGVLTKIGGGAAGFDYKPLDAAGNVIPLAGSPAVPSATPACERDNVTNLIWEVKTASGDLRDQNWWYTWFDGTIGAPDTGIGVLSDHCFNGARCDTLKYAADVNAAGLCGMNSGWRLPTRRELFSIVDYSAYNPSIDLNYFPNTEILNVSLYWTSEQGPGVPPTPFIWAVEFQSGLSYLASGPALNAHVRLVHDGP
jgi:Protein of unknown function (DUF1566)